MYINAKFIRDKQIFWSHSSVFALENLNCHNFLPLKDHLVTTFSERHTPTFRKNLSEQGRLMPNSSKEVRCFWWHYVFALKRALKMLKF